MNAGNFCKNIINCALQSSNSYCEIHPV